MPRYFVNRCLHRCSPQHISHSCAVTLNLSNFRFFQAGPRPSFQINYTCNDCLPMNCPWLFGMLRFSLLGVACCLLWRSLILSLWGSPILETRVRVIVMSFGWIGALHRASFRGQLRWPLSREKKGAAYLASHLPPNNGHYKRRSDRGHRPLCDS